MGIIAKRRAARRAAAEIAAIREQARLADRWGTADLLSGIILCETQAGAHRIADDRPSRVVVHSPAGDPEWYDEDGRVIVAVLYHV